MNLKQRIRDLEKKLAAALQKKEELEEDLVRVRSERDEAEGSIRDLELELEEYRPTETILDYLSRTDKKV